MKEIEILVAVTLPHVIIGGVIDKAKWTKMPGTILQVGKDIPADLAVKYCRGGIAWIPGGTCLDSDPNGKRGYALARSLPDEDRAELLTSEELAAIDEIEGNEPKAVKIAKPKAKGNEAE